MILYDKNYQNEIIAKFAIKKNVKTHIYRSMCVLKFSIKRIITIKNDYKGIYYKNIAM